MFTFTEFLKEKFERGIDGSFGYAELYKNPTLAELVQAVGGRLMGSVTKFYHVGAIIDGNTLWLWDRKHAEHRDAMEVIGHGKLSQNALPVYMEYYPNEKTTTVRLASFTLPQHQMHLRDTDAVRAARACSACKILGKIVSGDFA